MPGAPALDTGTLTRDVAVHRMGSTWSVCDSCGLRLAVWMVFAYDRPPPMAHASSNVWLVCDGCCPPPAMCREWSP